MAVFILQFRPKNNGFRGLNQAISCNLSFLIPGSIHSVHPQKMSHFIMIGLVPVMFLLFTDMVLEPFKTGGAD